MRLRQVLDLNNNRNFQALQDAIKSEMQLDPGLISDVERKVFINDCIKELGRTPLFEKYDDFPIIDGTVALPDDFVELIEVRYGHLLLKPSALQSMDITDTAPLRYAITYDVLNLYPATRTGTVRLFYVYKPATLSEPEDVPNIPNGWDNLIVDYAVGRAHRKNGNMSLYREYMGAFNSGKGELISELLKRSNTRVKDTIDTSTSNIPRFSEETLL